MSPASAGTDRSVLLARRELLAAGPLNWSDADIDQIASFTSMSVSELTTMRHKMERAREFSLANIEALDRHVAASPDSATLRPGIEGDLTLREALTRTQTFTGLFVPVKAALAALDADLARTRATRWPRWVRRVTRGA